ncbi:MAG: glucose-6-phosphate isomerase, partial [Desulfobacteria bacterium]
MLHKANPTKSKSWQHLSEHYEKIRDVHMKDLFANDPQRFNRFSTRFKDIFLDYSKNRITEETLQLLIELADEISLSDAIHQMFNGAKINETENRAVLHIALRNRENSPIDVDGNDVMPEVNGVLDKMKDFSNKVISGEWKGYSGQRISDIVNIGIG